MNIFQVLCPPGSPKTIEGPGRYLEVLGRWSFKGTGKNESAPSLSHL